MKRGIKRRIENYPYTGKKGVGVTNTCRPKTEGLFVLLFVSHNQKYPAQIRKRNRKRNIVWMKKIKGGGREGRGGGLIKEEEEEKKNIYMYRICIYICIVCRNHTPKHTHMLNKNIYMYIYMYRGEKKVKISKR